MEYLYETHMHTSEASACGVASGEQQAAAYKQRGYTGIIITDHFINGYSSCPNNLTWEEKMRFFVKGYENAKKTGDIIGLDVFLGWEWRNTTGSEFLTYGLDLDFLLSYPRLDIMSTEEYCTLAKESGGYIAQAHPYRDAYYIDHCFPVASHLIDGIEVINSSDKDSSNNKALAFALKYDLAIQAGTDSHGRGERYFTGIALKKKAESIFDIIDALKKKEVELL